MGGPYRLDVGQDVFQVPDWQKDMVPEEVRKAAREMGEKAFKEKCVCGSKISEQKRCLSKTHYRSIMVK